MNRLRAESKLDILIEKWKNRKDKSENLSIELNPSLMQAIYKARENLHHTNQLAIHEKYQKDYLDFCEKRKAEPEIVISNKCDKERE